MTLSTLVPVLALCFSVNGFLLSAEWNAFVQPAREELRELHQQVFTLQQECVKRGDYLIGGDHATNHSAK